MAGKTRTFSPTQINMFEDCPRKWYLRYHEGIEEAYNFYMARGTMVHATIEEFYDTFVPKSQHTLKKDMDTHILTIAPKMWDKFVRGLEVPRDDGYDETIVMFETWAYLTHQRIQPLIKRYGIRAGIKMAVPKSETKYSIYNDQKERVFTGKLDSIITDVDGMVWIVDYKTSKMIKLPYTHEYERQLFAYTWLYAENNNGQIPHYVAIDWLRYGYLVPVPLFLMPRHGQEVIDTFRGRFEEIQRHCTSDDKNDYPMNFKYQYCTPHNCFYWKEGHCDAKDHKAEWEEQHEQKPFTKKKQGFSKRGGKQ